MIRAVLFDLDNTLIDRDAALRAFAPRSIWALDASGRGDRAALFAAWDGMTQELLAAQLAARLRPDPRLQRFLREIPKRALVTNGGGPTQRAKLRATGLDEIFGMHVYISGELGMEKPDPAIFRHACARLQERPEACLYVGDYPPEDERGARAAGLRFALATRPLA